MSVWPAILSELGADTSNDRALRVKLVGLVGSRRHCWPIVCIERLNRRCVERSYFRMHTRLYGGEITDRLAARFLPMIVRFRTGLYAQTQVFELVFVCVQAICCHSRRTILLSSDAGQRKVRGGHPRCTDVPAHPRSKKLVARSKRPFFGLSSSRLYPRRYASFAGRSKLADKPCQRTKCGRWFIKLRPRQKCCSRRCTAVVQSHDRNIKQRKDAHKESLAKARTALRQWRSGNRRSDWKTFVSARTKLSAKWLTRAINKGELKVPK